MARKPKKPMSKVAHDYLIRIVTVIVLIGLGLLFAGLSQSTKWFLTRLGLTCLALAIFIIGFTFFDIVDTDHDWWKEIHKTPYGFSIFLAILMLCLLLIVLMPV